jgi:murein tripeptide amidase MpaA
MVYLNVQEVESAIISLASVYPNLCELITLPLQTHEGRTCHVLRIGKKPNTECGCILLTGGVHAREWGSCEICTSFASDLLDAYVTNTGLQYGGKIFSNNQVRTIIENLNIIIFPDVNPDGRNHSQTVAPMWRKNRNPTAGVDINRNFDFLWDFPNLFSPSSFVHSTTSTIPSSDVYHGPSPFSEPETRNVLWLFDEFPRIRWYIDIHSYSQLLLYNWGDDQNQSTDFPMNFRNHSYNSVRGIRNDSAYREFIPSDDLTRIVSLANHMDNSISAVRGKNYTVQQSFDLYPTAGTSDDHAYGRHFTYPSKGKIFAYTIEWGTEFQPPWVEMEKIIVDISSALVTFCLEAQLEGNVDRIIVKIQTGNKSGAGTNGKVYLGIGGREFRLNKSGNQFQKDKEDEFIIGVGSNILKPDQNGLPLNSSFANDSPEIPFNVVSIYPMYIRFEPSSSSDKWNVDRVYVNVKSTTDLPPAGLDFHADILNGLNDDNIWLSEDSGLFIGLRSRGCLS